MPTNYSRDPHTQPLLPSHRCRPISPSFRFCAGDVTAIVVTAVSIWYIVWGIPLTIRCYKLISAKVEEHRRRRLGDAVDPEKAAYGDEGKGDPFDPFLSPTSSLRTRLQAYKELAFPAPVHSPSGSVGRTDAGRSDGSCPKPSSEALFTSSSSFSLPGSSSPPLTRTDIASPLPACPPLARLGHASGIAAATCKPCTW
ncbi:hypothetical protein K466DRAFT_381321 [Polyporus arcularius HHB13444]|uniref:Uncharacterized protein n=1 Tax=Polyporus arcularius HHB13444 TaxID=1314778 RepID=A0A5C3PMK6_9APHY|nr:hypothetical protein K466DRAFT_381321 [Polyporus arcularius HHB13444]